jgi:lipoprotein-anchoring transpeptidase ErfK/SrfK
MRRAALLPILGAAVALASPSAASADGPPPPVPAPTPTPTPAPPPPAQPGAVTLTVGQGLVFHGRHYVLTGDAVIVKGLVKPYVAGQKVRVQISAPHRKTAHAYARIGRGGTFHIRFRTRRAVVYTIRVRHAATAKQHTFTGKTSVAAVDMGSGLGIALLKQGLRALGYQAGNGPSVTDKMGRELLAFRKVNEMERVYTPSHHIYEMVFAGQGAFRLRYPKAGKHVEADLSKQVVVLANNGAPVATYPTSSGKPSTPTVLGHYHFYLKAPGTNAKGMFMSNYFTGGYAIHGYPDVPTYNASHGCLRISNADAVSVFNQIDLGESIWVYP